MKHIFLSLLLPAIAVFSSPARTADRAYNIYGQFLGTSTGAGIGLDTRFKPGGVLGYAAGVAFTDITWDDGILGASLDGFHNTLEVHSTGVAIPLEINAIIGSRASKFEVEIGATAYLISRNENRLDMGRFPEAADFYSHRKVFRPNIAATLGIGYRLQRKSGFFMKLGLNLILGDLNWSPIHSYVPLPNICLGWTIRHSHRKTHECRGCTKL